MQWIALQDSPPLPLAPEALPAVWKFLHPQSQLQTATDFSPFKVIKFKRKLNYNLHTPKKSRRKDSGMNKKAVISPPDARPLTLKLLFYSFWNSSELWKESDQWQTAHTDRFHRVGSTSGELLWSDFSGMRDSEGEVWGRFVWASTAQPTTYLGGEPTATEEKPSSPNASSKVTQCINLGTAPPSICQTRCPTPGGHQGSLERPRWNLLLLEQMKYISKFRTSSCS